MGALESILIFEKKGGAMKHFFKNIVLISTLCAYVHASETCQAFKYIVINKTKSPVQVIQEFKDWCGLNIFDLGPSRSDMPNPKSELNAPTIMNKICFGIDQKILTCPVNCLSKSHCWYTDKPNFMEPGVWIIEEFKAGHVPQINVKDPNLGIIDRIVMPQTTAGIVYTITRCKHGSCLYDLAK